MLHLTDRRLTAFAILIATALLSASVARAEARHSAMIIDANTGAVLYDRAGDELRHPASLTKMMTLYMAFELIEMGRLSYNTPIKVTAEAAAAAPSKLELEPGETIPLIDAMKALVTKSANDMAIAIAQHIGGSEANFARLMTEKAHQLGMRRTVFRNASGLPNDEQVTTARDMITLGLHLQDDFPKHYPLFGLRTFNYNGGSYRNHNTLLLSYRGTDGIKTGYTRKSGFNLVANVRRDGKHLIGAIFGGESAGSRNAQLRSLLDHALPRAATTRTRRAPQSPMLVAERAAAEKPTRVARAETAPQPKPAVRPRAATAAPPPAPATTAPLRSAAPAAPTLATAPALQPATRSAAAQPTDAAAPAMAAESPDSDAAAPTTTATATREAATEEAAVSPAVSAAEKALAAVGSSTDAAAQADQAAPNSNPTIAVARVRRVMVAPHVTRPPVTVAAEGLPDAASPAKASPAKDGAAQLAPPQAAIADGPAPTFAAAPIAPRIAAGQASPPTVATGRAPSSFEAQVAALAANVVPSSTSRTDRADTTAPSPLPTPGSDRPQLGRAPSTLGAQANAIGGLARGEQVPQQRPQQVASVAPPSYRLNGPQQPAAVARGANTRDAAPAQGGAFQIQIGAFLSAAEAERRLGAVQNTAGAVLNGHAPLTMPVAKSNRTLYRARFANFDANSAAAACLELRRQQVDCFVMKGE